jgi:uncharacterized protein (TIGR02246 family)
MRTFRTCMIGSLVALSFPAVAQTTSHEQAIKVADSVVKSFMAAYDTRDPKAVAALFLPNAMTLSANGAVSQGREAIERNYADGLKNLGGHYTIVIKDAIPLGSDVVVCDG